MLKPDATRAQIVAKVNELDALLKVLVNAHPLGITPEGDVVVRQHVGWQKPMPTFAVGDATNA